MKSILKSTIFTHLTGTLLAFATAAEETAPFPRILTEDYPILNYKTKDTTTGKEIVTGVSTDVVRAIAKELGQPQCDIEIMFWGKALKDTQNATSPVALYSTTKTPEREKLYKWVGPITKLRWQLCKLRSNSKIKIASLEDAKKVNKIGTYYNDAGEKILMNAGLQNLDRNKNAYECFDKLIRKEIDLCTTSDVNISGVAKTMGIDLSQLEVAFTFQEDPLYIAFSLATPNTVIEQWQSTLETLKKDHKLDDIYKRWGVEAP